MFAEGGLFSTGDGHGVQGDGEVNLTALETSISGTFRFTVRKDMEEEPFIGSEALVKRKANPQRKLVGLDIDSNDCVHHGDPVYRGRAQIGIVTSSTRSPVLKKNIALARLDVTNADLGTEAEIGKLDGHQKRIPAKVVGFPHYDPQKTRVRA